MSSKKWIAQSIKKLGALTSTAKKEGAVKIRWGY